MKIKTSYDCEFEQRDLANLAAGHALAATLSDGSIAFKFRMDPALVQPNGPRRVAVVAEDTPPRLLTTGKPARKKTSIGGACHYCKKDYRALYSHIRKAHPDKAVHATGKFRCSQCPQRYITEHGLALHGRFSHKAKKEG